MHKHLAWYIKLFYTRSHINIIYIYINVSNKTLYSTVEPAVLDTEESISFKRD